MAGERRRRLSPNVVALVVLALVGTALALWQRPWMSSTDDPPAVGVVADAPKQLSRQLRAASEATSRSQLVTAFGGGTGKNARLAGDVWSSLRQLDASDVALRYVSGGDVPDRADGSAQANVEVMWRPGRSTGLRDVLHRSSVVLRVAPQPDGTFAITTAAPRSGAMPIWLIGPVTVQQGRGSVVVSVDGGSEARRATPRMAELARASVVRSLPEVGSSGKVVIVSPRTQEQMAHVVGQPRAAVRQIAAVTTRLDVTNATTGDAVVVLNPAVFATMDDRAAQIVLNHEATHQLTGAVGSRAEPWVIEGFADYVALRDDSAPLSVSAGQILARVRADQAPDALPTAADFAAEGGGLGAVYESSWLIFRVLAEQHSAARIVSFYEAVRDGAEVRAALRDAFGLSLQQLTDQWRDYLTKSASTVS